MDAVQRMFARHTAETWASSMARMDFQEPNLVATLLQWAVKNTFIEEPVLDAGCGSGLLAPLIKKSCRRIDGVDFSPSMIEAARKSGCYDNLDCAEAVSFMQSREGYSAVVASSLCLFLSDLRPLFVAAHHTLLDGGVFVFTADLHNGEQEVIVSPRHHAMTLHSPKHIIMGGWEAGLELLAYQQCRMRNDYFQLQPIEGVVVVFRRPLKH
jgi:predicted TPR repeat methyltransferase